MFRQNVKLNYQGPQEAQVEKVQVFLVDKEESRRRRECKWRGKAMGKEKRGEEGSEGMRELVNDRG